MNEFQKGIVKELMNVARRLNKSPVRREFTSGFNAKCIKHFGSFNKAKIKAGLSINEKNRTVPKKDLRLDGRLARIVSYLTFDGHLDKKLRMFYFSSSNTEELERLRKDVYNKFNLDVSKIEKGNGYGKNVLKYWYFHANLCKFLYSVGTPKGNKVLTKFRVPKWIKENKTLAREYLRIAFYCEGSWKEHRSKPRLKFNINKSEELRTKGILFLQDLREMLKGFDIETTPVSVYEGNKWGNKEGIKELRFRILTKDNHKFIKQIGWYK